ASSPSPALATRVRAAPLWASAAAAASPMPRLAPVTIARRPSRRKLGVAGRPVPVIAPVIAPLIVGPPSVGDAAIGDVPAAVAAHADVGLLAVTDEAFESAEA